MKNHSSGRCVLVALLFCLASTLSQGQDLRQPEFIEESRQGFNYLYNLDYPEARESFEDLRRHYPEHPAPLLYLSLVIWLPELFERQELDLNRFVAPGYFTEPSPEEMPAPERTAFFEHIQRSQEITQLMLEKHPRHQDARYFLGLSYGLLGSFAITIDRSKTRAFDHGKKAYRYHKELVEEDLTYYDAYMSAGLYEYIVDNLPWYIKWLAVIIGYRGDEEQGLRYLSLAAEKGKYVSDDARLLQMVLLVREQRYQEALSNARLLHSKYPRNYLFHLNQAQILEWMGKTEESIQEYLQIVKLAQKGEPNYSRLPVLRFRYDLGSKFVALKRHDLALEQFQACLSSAQTPERLKVLSHLQSGQILDLQGKRREAVTHYQRVLQLPPYDHSHQQARSYLKRPYTG